MSDQRYPLSEPSFSPYSPYNLTTVQANTSPQSKGIVYHELSLIPPEVKAKKLGPRRSARKKGKKNEMAETWTKSQVANDTKQRYEATLNFLHRNNLLDVTMKAVELEKRNAMIIKKMEQLRFENIKYCNV